MKKNFVRIVAALLVAMLALTLIPMGAFAAEAAGDVRGVFVDKWIGGGTSIYDYTQWFPYGESDWYDIGETIKTSDYDELLIIDGKKYDFAGFEDSVKYAKIDDEAMKKIFGTDDPSTIDWASVSEKQLEQYKEWAKETAFPFYNKDVKIPGENASQKEIDAFVDQWGFNPLTYSELVHVIFAGYVPHSHSLTCWISDGTTHWKNCTVCRKQLINQNWCQDGDEDGICNICGGDVPYHDIKIIETEGATITLNRDNASHRMKITADVQAKDGYTTGKVHFVKVRDDGSRQEITRYKKDGQIFTYMPTYEMEVSVDVTKK